MIDFSPLEARSKKTALELYPFLMDIDGVDEFRHPDKDAVLKYMLLAYHPKSFMVERYTEVNKRKEEAALLAGLSKSRPKDERLMEMLFEHTLEDFVKVLNAFLIHVNSRLWSMVTANEYVFWEYQEKLISPLSIEIGKDKDALTAAGIKGKLMEEMEKINDRLDRFYHRLYMDDTKLITRSTKKKGITLESIAGGVHKV